MIALILAVIFAIIYVTRWLDYWEILPNEILHHHGPLSDLERFPTMNLKFDKEIPDVLEYLFLGAGRLVLHVTEERKAIVLDNVLFINSQGSRAEEPDEPDGSPGHDRPGSGRASEARRWTEAGSFASAGLPARSAGDRVPVELAVGSAGSRESCGSGSGSAGVVGAGRAGGERMRPSPSPQLVEDLRR